MEAIRTLIQGDLPPAGNAITLRQSSQGLPSFPGYHAYWVDSGTSALALALLAAKQKHHQIQTPEVIIPAYCCPDLVAAADFAGIKSVMVDITKDDPALDLAAVSAAINERTIAIIAVNFLGIRERLPELTSLLKQYPQVSLIEDNAQWFPESDELSSLAGDFVVFSFGRGKPLSLLGGGLLLAKEPQETLVNSLAKTSASPLILTVKYLVYNLLLIPQFYQLLNRNPLLTLGATRYHSHHNIHPLDDFRASLLANNAELYSQRRRDTENYYDELFGGMQHNGLTALRSERRKRLLRYPVLLKDSAQRDHVIKRLQQAGLGVTAMYQRPLVEIEGMKDRVVCATSYQHAADFATRFMTLPVHEGVTNKHLERITAIIKDLT